MSKYQKGDKFIVEIKEVMESDNGTLYRSNFKTLTFDDYGLDTLQKCETELSWDECYNKGLEDAWKVAKKIIVDFRNKTGDEFLDIFGCYCTEVFVAHTPQEALAKLEEYEKEQAKIKVGDVVQDRYGKKLVTTRVSEDKTLVECFGAGGYVHKYDYSFVTKTGKHIDIQSVLSQIAE